MNIPDLELFLSNKRKFHSVNGAIFTCPDISVIQVSIQYGALQHGKILNRGVIIMQTLDWWIITEE